MSFHLLPTTFLQKIIYLLSFLFPFWRCRYATYISAKISQHYQLSFQLAPKCHLWPINLKVRESECVSHYPHSIFLGTDLFDRFLAFIVAFLKHTYPYTSSTLVLCFRGYDTIRKKIQLPLVVFSHCLTCINEELIIEFCCGTSSSCAIWVC